VLHLYSVGAGGAEGAPEEPCSKALGFNESNTPKDRSYQDLQFCTEHHKRTCCERNHTRQVLNHFAPFSMDRTPRCSQMSRLVLCSLCDGDVGVGLKAKMNTVLLCPSFCARWFQACFDDFFAPSGSSGASLQPCGPGALVCSPLGEIMSEPSAFCSSAGGFSVAENEDDEDHPCYDGVPAARIHGRAEKNPWSKPKPWRPPWWRKMLREMFDAWRMFFRILHKEVILRMPRWLQAYAPALVVTPVLLIIGWCLLRGGDD